MLRSMCIFVYISTATKILFEADTDSKEFQLDILLLFIKDYAFAHAPHGTLVEAPSFLNGPVYETGCIKC